MLADAEIVGYPRRVAEDIDTQLDAERLQRGLGALEQPRDGRQAIFFGVGQGELGDADVAVGGEADVVVLNLIEAHPRRLDRQRNVVIPHRLVVRVDPPHLLRVAPDLPGVGVDHRPLRVGLRQQVVLADRDAGDGVDAAILEPLEKRGRVLDHRLAVGADLLRSRHLRGEGELAAVPLEVHDDRI